MRGVLGLYLAAGAKPVLRVRSQSQLQLALRAPELTATGAGRQSILPHVDKYRFASNRQL